MNHPKISIITVSLNSAHCIEQTLLSVINQDYSNIEYIVQDGLSTDGTIEIVSKYPQVRLFSEKDAGIYDAMNKAKKKATGDFLLYLGADDLLYSNNVITEFVNHLMAEDDVYYGSVLRIKKQVVFDGEFSKWKWGYQNVCHQCIFYPRSIYSKKDYDPQYKLVADWVYNLQLLASGVNFHYVDLVIAKYNDVDGISSTRVDKHFLKERKNLVVNAVGILPYYWGLIAKAKKRIL